MKIELLEAKNNFGKWFEIDMATKIDSDCFEPGLCKPLNLCTLHIKYRYQEDGVVVIGKGSLPVEYTCIKCGTPFPYELQFEFSELFQDESEVEVDEEDQKGNYFFKQNALILDKCLRDSIILATPQNLKCSQDCKGVCPYCYANLNETQCDCEEKNRQQNNPFSALKQGL